MHMEGCASRAEVWLGRRKAKGPVWWVGPGSLDLSALEKAWARAYSENQAEGRGGGLEQGMGQECLLTLWPFGGVADLRA